MVVVVPVTRFMPIIMAGDVVVVVPMAYEATRMVIPVAGVVPIVTTMAMTVMSATVVVRSTASTVIGSTAIIMAIVPTVVRITYVDVHRTNAKMNSTSG